MLTLSANIFVGRLVVDQNGDATKSATTFIYSPRPGSHFLVTNAHVLHGASRLRLVAGSLGSRSINLEAELTIVGNEGTSQGDLAAVELDAIPEFRDQLRRLAPAALEHATPILATSLPAGTPVVSLGYPSPAEPGGYNLTRMTGTVSPLAPDDGDLEGIEMILDMEAQEGASGSPVIHEAEGVSYLVGVMSSGCDGIERKGSWSVAIKASALTNLVH